MTQGTREQHGGPFEFVASRELVHVLLKKDAATINGSTVRVDNGPAAEAFVVLAPKNRKALNRYRTASTLKDGSFSLSRVAPGEYDLFAFHRNDEDNYQGEEYLRRFASHGTSVKVAANATMSAQPELIAN